MDIKDFEDIVVLKPQDDLDRPVPFIKEYIPTGLMTIAWDRKMRPYERPKEIPETKVAIDSSVYQMSGKA